MGEGEGEGKGGREAPPRPPTAGVVVAADVFPARHTFGGVPTLPKSLDLILTSLFGAGKPCDDKLNVQLPLCVSHLVGLGEER